MVGVGGGRGGDRGRRGGGRRGRGRRAAAACQLQRAKRRAEAGAKPQQAAAIECRSGRHQVAAQAAKVVVIVVM